MNWLKTRDHRASKYLNLSEHPGVRRTMAIIVTRSGDISLPLVGMGALLAFGPPLWKERAFALLIIDLINLLTTLTLKVSFGRKRPEGEWGQSYRKIDPNSFPSGHSSRGGALGLAAILVAPAWFGLPLLIWGMAIAFSRVVMGVHYLSDVIVGYGWGLLIGGVLVFLLF